MDWVDRGWYLVVEFEKSSSGLFDLALKQAEAHESHCQLMDHRGHVFHRVVYGHDDTPQAIELLDIIGQWRGARAYLKGHAVSPAVVRTQLDCYAWRLKVGRVGECPLLPVPDWPFPTALGCQWGSAVLDWNGPGWGRHCRSWFESGKVEHGCRLVTDKPHLRKRLKAGGNGKLGESVHSLGLFSADIRADVKFFNFSS